MNKLNINYNKTFLTKHSRDYYRGSSFHFSGEWIVGAHYMSDDYEVDFVVHDQVLLACAKSHLSSIENEPKDFIYDEKGNITGVVSKYWDFVLSGIVGKHGKMYIPTYNSETGEIVWNLVEDNGSNIEQIIASIPMSLATLKDDENHRTVSDEQIAYWNDKLDVISDKGNSGLPVYFDSEGNVEPIEYLSVGTEQGSIILPFFSNDIAFLDKRGGSITPYGDYEGEPEFEKAFNGKPDYVLITPTDEGGIITLDLMLPTDTLYTYGEKLYIDFGSADWRASSIKVDCYQATLVDDEIQSEPYKRINATCNGSFWVSELINPDDQYKLKRIVIKFSDFVNWDITSGFRITEIGIQRFLSEGMAASHMSRGIDDPVYRSITPNQNNTYDLGTQDKNWRNLYASNGTFEDIYIKDSNDTVSLNGMLSNFITNTVDNLTNYYKKSETYSRTEVANLVSMAIRGSFQAVSELPTASANTLGVIYLVPSSVTDVNNVKNEFITVENNGVYSWEQIGSTVLDLSGYARTSDIPIEQGSGESSIQQKGNNQANGDYSVAEGIDTIASGTASHTEGTSTTANGSYSHAEGNNCTAYEESTHAEGENTYAEGYASHTEGFDTSSQNLSEHAEGSFNKSNKASDTYGDAGNTQHSIGIGTSSSDRKNAFEVMQSGDAYLYGVGNYDGTNPSNASTVQSVLGNYTLDHNTAVTDHNTAVSDHSTAVSDHNTAVNDHNTSENDHASYLQHENTIAHKADIDGSYDGMTVGLAKNLESWEGESLMAEDPQSLAVFTTGGDMSIDSSVPALLVEIAAKTDFSATSLLATGFNLLRLTSANGPAKAVGAGYYFPVPALPFGSINTAEQPNGVLFTSRTGENLRPTVYFKKLSQGVPTSVTDGIACSYTDAVSGDKSYRFYNPTEPGYIIVSGITWADTCAHIGWSKRYDEFIAPDDASDAGHAIALTAAITAAHSFGKLLTVGASADRIRRISATQVQWETEVDRVQPAWTNTLQEDGETYLHTATIAAMKADGAAQFMTVSQQLTIGGTTISYTDTSATAYTDFVKYEKAAHSTGTVSLATALTVEDWGLIILLDAAGEAFTTIAYAQNIPDNVRALVSARLSGQMEIVAQAFAELYSWAEDITRRLFGAQGHPIYRATEVDAQTYRIGNIPREVHGAGAPSAAVIPVDWDKLCPGVTWRGFPLAPGMVYTDDTNSKVYKAKAVLTNAVSDWILLN